MSDSLLNPTDISNREPETKKAKTGNLARNVLVTLGAILLVVLGGVGVVAIAREKPELFGIKKVSTDDGNSQKELESLITEVGKIIDLPLGETPTLATVTDLDQVKEQPFFAKAKNGDKVLVYNNAKRAILYRPSANKIIEVGAVNVSSNLQGPGPEAAGEMGPTNTLSPASSITPEPTTLP